MLQWAAIISALVSDGWSAKYCGKPLAMWLEVHAGLLFYDLIPVWCVDIRMRSQLDDYTIHSASAATHALLRLASSVCRDCAPILFYYRAVFILPVNEFMRLNNCVASLKCLSGLFRSV